MKKKLLSLLLALVMVLSLAATAMATPDMEWDEEEEESNDTFVTAQPIKLKQTYSGMAWLNRDTDLFRLTLEEAKEIRLSAFAYDDDINPFEIALFDADGKILTKAVHVGTGDESSMREYLTFPMALEAGDYYVGICVTGTLGEEQSVGHDYYFEVNEGVFPCEGYHRPFFGHVTTPATCVSEGEKLMTCPCGYTEIQVLPIDAEAHTWSTTVITPATCTENGAAHNVCTGCGAEEDVVLEAAHTAEYRVVEQEPTDTEYGWYTVYCADCGELVWEESPISPLTQSFIDVEEGSFYEVPVAWAAYHEITNGVDSFRFGPDASANRAQVVTFLWRAAGEPEPTTAENPFVDVQAGSFYEKAVLWAVEMGITNGTDETHFSPNLSCNRATVVTFLHRAAGSPAAQSAENPFTDVPADTWYTVPVLWAVEQGITNGLSATEFGPDASCNRAQIVTFLYRAYQ